MLFLAHLGLRCRFSLGRHEFHDWLLASGIWSYRGNVVGRDRLRRGLGSGSSRLVHVDVLVSYSQAQEAMVLQKKRETCPSDETRSVYSIRRSAKDAFPSIVIEGIWSSDAYIVLQGRYLIAKVLGTPSQA